MSKFESSPVTKKFLHQKQAHLSDPTVRVVAGVSGGPDSMAMLYLLHRFDIDTVVVHCNYQLRGAASDKDQELVEKLCMHWNLECVSLRFDTSGESEGNFQNWARNRRYTAFRDIKKEYNARLILTAHHEDDQIETILQKMLRGAGMGSWKGMDILEDDLLRPFLNLSKSDIMEFVQDFNVPYRIDRTNEESTYARNFIRQHWFPDLNRLFPGWKKNLQKIEDRAEEFSILSDLVLGQIAEGTRELNREKFLALPSKVQPGLFLHFIQKSGIDVEVSRGFLNNTGSLPELQSGGKVQISDEIFIVRDRSVFRVVRETSFASVNQKIEENQLEDSLNIGDLELSINPVPDKFSESVLHLDKSALKFPLMLRTWEAGDEIQPFGMEGTQLVSDHLTNRKIPSSLREKALVLESFDTTVRAVIFPTYPEQTQVGTISNSVKCTLETQKTVTIRKID